MLIDCGEGTQRQLLRSTIGLIDLPEVFLTHYHADHYLGLPGMLKTFALRGREMPLTVHGPPGLKDLFGGLRRIFGKLTYPVELVELRDGDVLDRGEYRVPAFRVSARPRRTATRSPSSRARVGSTSRQRVRWACRRPGAGALQAGETVSSRTGGGARRTRSSAPARPGRKVVAHRRHGPRRERARDGE